MNTTHRIVSWRVALLFLAVVLLFSLASGVWASPAQDRLRQSVPTRTPVPVPDTPVPEPTAQPTEEPPTAQPTDPPATAQPATAEPTKKPKAATAAPTQANDPTATVAPVSGATATPVVVVAATGTVIATPQPGATPTNAASTVTEYSQTGADRSSLLMIGVGMILLLVAAASYTSQRRRSTWGR